MKKHIDRLLKGSRGSLAKIITALENCGGENREILDALQKQGGNAFILGITGPPGAGKSTLVSRLTACLRKRNLRVGIIAVDPSSPFTGGAVLGDRIRMNAHSLDEGVFMRSMSARGSLGGLSAKTWHAALAMDAFGMDTVIIETVGVGQSETDIAGTADITAVVLAPGFGDDIQALKAGILEIGDLFAVNKSDLPHAEKLVRELEQMLAMDGRSQVPVIKCSAKDAGDAGAEEIAERALKQFGEMKRTGALEEKRIKRTALRLLDLLQQQAQMKIREKIEKSGGLETLAGEITANRQNFFEVCDRVLKDVL